MIKKSSKSFFEEVPSLVATGIIGFGKPLLLRTATGSMLGAYRRACLRIAGKRFFYPVVVTSCGYFYFCKANTNRDKLLRMT
jgi:hypothetical protein